MRQNPELFNSKLSTHLLRSVLSCADVLIESESHCYSCDSCKCPDQDFPAPLYVDMTGSRPISIKSTHKIVKSNDCFSRRDFMTSVPRLLNCLLSMIWLLHDESHSFRCR